jgi:hypothetical protein
VLYLLLLYIDSQHAVVLNHQSFEDQNTCIYTTKISYYKIVYWFINVHYCK